MPTAAAQALIRSAVCWSSLELDRTSSVNSALVPSLVQVPPFDGHCQPPSASTCFAFSGS